MAIVEMSKLKLVGLSCHKDEILNALQKTGSVQLSFDQKTANETEEGFALPNFVSDGQVKLVYQKLQKTVSFYTDTLEKCKDKSYYPENSSNVFSNFIVNHQEFTDIINQKEEIFQLADNIRKIEQDLTTFKSKKVRYNNLLTQVLPYRDVECQFSDFEDSQHTSVLFGTIKAEGYRMLKEFIKDQEYVDVQLLSENNQAVILVVGLKGAMEQTVKKLGELAFSKCTFNDRLTPNQKIEQIQQKINKVDEQTEVAYQTICSYVDSFNKLRLLTDYYKFLVEKEENFEQFSYTSKTFMLDAYLPTQKIEEVKESILKVSSAVFMQFSKPSENDCPPTLTKNNKVISQAEFITDMYSVPNYRERDPNKTVFFFFMLFMGVIMADVGYGFIMIALGLALALRIKVNNGVKKLWNLIAIGGVFSIIFGLFFNSCFGFAILPNAILPSPVKGGIDDIMTILLLCLLLGVIQIAVGYFMKALNCFHQGEILDGILDGLVWVLFFIGGVFAVFNFILDYLMSDAFVLNAGVRAFFDKMQPIGLITVITCLVISALTAGRKEKGFGKFSKGFGAIYGLINIMSDILSYARLFGLMLSGMIIADTFNNIATGIMANGGLMVIFGVLIMVIGHTFNIAMGVLGAYIHDSRLQYIEYFSKFYTGEGEKFSPIGSQFNYIYLTK